MAEGSKYERIANLLDSIYPKGTYDTEGRHDDLNLDYYCHCTSSLRRAQDILIEHALEVCYDNAPTDEELLELKDEIEKRKLQINSRVKPVEGLRKNTIEHIVKKVNRNKVIKAYNPCLFLLNQQILTKIQIFV